MKVAFLLGSLNRGGTETLLLDVFRNAAKNGLDVIGIYRKPGVYETEFLSCGVEIHKFTLGKNPVSYLFRLRKLLLKRNIQIVHAQQPIDALYAKLACMATGISVVLTFHGYDFNNKRFSQFILRYIIKKTDVNIYVSATQSRYYTEKYKLIPQNQKVVYNGISFDKFNSFVSIQGVTSGHPMSKAQSIRSELHLTKQTLLFGSVGNFVPVRDQFTICRFLKLLKQEKLNFHFVFIGGPSEAKPELYSNCYEFCRENDLLGNVSFLGSRGDVPSILPDLDAFVYSTDHDTFGIAVVEAMAVSIPVFVNDWSVMNEITENGKYATIYKTKNEEDLLDKFTHFLENRNEYMFKTMLAKEFVENSYSIQSHIQDLKKNYQSVLEI